MHRNSPNSIRSCRVIHHNAVLHPVEVHPVADPIEVLQHGLERQHPEPHDGGRERRHADIGPHVHHQPTGRSAPPHLPAEQLLDGRGDVGLAEELALEEARDVLVRVVGESAHVGERVEERVGHVLHEVGDDRESLLRGVAVDGAEVAWKVAGGGGGSGGGRGEG